MVRLRLGRLLLAAIMALPLAGHAESIYQLYQQVLDSNPVLRGKEYAVDRAKAIQSQALSKLLPQLLITGNYNWNSFNQDIVLGTTGQDRTYWGKTGTLQAKQPLFDLPSFLRLQGADSLVFQSEKELDAVRMAVAWELIDRYLNVLQATDGINYIQSEKKQIEGQLLRLRKMYELQMAKVTDLYQVEAYYQTLSSQEIAVNNAKAIAMETLRETTGVAVEKVMPLASQEFPPMTKPVEEWVDGATRFNPRLSALQHAIDAAGKSIDSSRAEHLPLASLVLSETYSDLGYQNRQSSNYLVGSAGVQLTVPLYEGGGVQARVEESVARLQIVKEEYQKQVREIEKETRKAYLNVASSHAEIASLAQEVKAKEKAAEAQERAYELGTATIIDVLEARKLLFKARFERSKSCYDYIRAFIGLRLWAGNLSDHEIEEISAWMVAS